MTQPLSNTNQYLVKISGQSATQYQLIIQTIQDDSVTASAHFTRPIAYGETQGVAVQLDVAGGIISFTTSTPAVIPEVGVEPAQIQLAGLPDTLVHTMITINEVSDQQAINGVSISVSDAMNQVGQVITGTSFVVTPTSFDVPAGGSQTVQLEIDLANVEPGLYQGGLVIASASGGSQLVPLSLLAGGTRVHLPIVLKNPAQ